MSLHLTRLHPRAIVGHFRPTFFFNKNQRKIRRTQRNRPIYYQLISRHESVNETLLETIQVETFKFKTFA